MADFETEVSVKYPYKSNKDSDFGSYFSNNHAQDSLCCRSYFARESWFNAQDESADTSGDDWE